MVDEESNDHTVYIFSINGLINQIDTSQYPDLTDEQMLTGAAAWVGILGAPSVSLYKTVYTGTTATSYTDLTADPPVFT